MRLRDNPKRNEHNKWVYSVRALCIGRAAFGYITRWARHHTTVTHNALEQCISVYLSTFSPFNPAIVILLAAIRTGKKGAKHCDNFEQRMAIQNTCTNQAGRIEIRFAPNINTTRRCLFGHNIWPCALHTLQRYCSKWKGDAQSARIIWNNKTHQTTFSPVHISRCDGIYQWTFWLPSTGTPNELGPHIDFVGENLSRQRQVSIYAQRAFQRRSTRGRADNADSKFVEGSTKNSKRECIRYSFKCAASDAMHQTMLTSISDDKHPFKKEPTKHIQMNEFGITWQPYSLDDAGNDPVVGATDHRWQWERVH